MSVSDILPPYPDGVSMADDAAPTAVEDATDIGSRVMQAVASLQETIRESSVITARSRAILATITVRGNARSCRCGSADAYTTLTRSMWATYQRCRSCSDVWVAN